MKSILFTALIATAFATPALAQAPNPTFTGPRVEALVGYDNLGASLDGDGDRSSEDNLVYGIGAGFDFAVGGAVVGVEGEYADSLAKADFDGEASDGFDTFSVTDGRIKSGRDLYIGARAGFLASPRVLVYAKGGYINSSIDVRGDLDDGFDTFRLDESIRFDGYRIGGGAELAFAENLFGKLEYRYSKYSGGELDFDGESIDIGDAFDSVDLDRHQVVAGIGLRF